MGGGNDRLGTGKCAESRICGGPGISAGRIENLIQQDRLTAAEHAIGGKAIGGQVAHGDRGRSAGDAAFKFTAHLISSRCGRGGGRVITGAAGDDGAALMVTVFDAPEVPHALVAVTV